MYHPSCFDVNIRHECPSERPDKMPPPKTADYSTLGDPECKYRQTAPLLCKASGRKKWPTATKRPQCRTHPAPKSPAERNSSSGRPGRTVQDREWPDCHRRAGSIRHRAPDGRLWFSTPAARQRTIYARQRFCCRRCN